MKVPRSEIAKRCLLLRCPNCDARGQLRSWFRLQPACPQCGLKHSDEDGFSFGTTSIGFVVACVFIVVPVCLLVAMNLLSVWLGIVLAIAGTAVVSVGIYPIFLGWILMTYYVSTAEALPANKSIKANDQTGSKRG
jgi:uncharacterized protein (DUF983 family)